MTIHTYAMHTYSTTLYRTTCEKKPHSEKDTINDMVFHFRVQRFTLHNRHKQNTVSCTAIYTNSIPTGG